MRNTQRWTAKQNRQTPFTQSGVLLFLLFVMLLFSAPDFHFCWILIESMEVNQITVYFVITRKNKTNSNTHTKNHPNQNKNTISATYAIILCKITLNQTVDSKSLLITSILENAPARQMHSSLIRLIQPPLFAPPVSYIIYSICLYTSFFKMRLF